MKMKKIEKLAIGSMAAACMVTTLGCLGEALKNNKQVKAAAYKAPKNQIERQLDKNPERITAVNLLQGDYINSYFFIEECQKKVAIQSLNENEIENDMQFILTNLNQNSQKLFSLVDELLKSDNFEAREHGVINDRTDDSKVTGAKLITDYDKNILEKIAMKYEVCQFLQAGNLVRNGMDKQSDNIYLHGLENNDLRANSTKIIELAKQNILELPEFNKGTNTASFAELDLYNRMFILADHIPSSAGDIEVRNCLALEILTQHQLNKYLSDLEEKGYDVNKIALSAQNGMKDNSFIEQKKKSKFIKQDIQIQSNTIDANEVSK